MSLQKYRELSQQAETSPEYWTDLAVSDFARELALLMKRRNVTNAELARRLGVKRQYVSKLLSGTNVTLGTMVKLAMALDAVVRIRLETNEEREERMQTAADAEGEVVVDLPEHRPSPEHLRVLLWDDATGERLPSPEEAVAEHSAAEKRTKTAEAEIARLRAELEQMRGQ
jgi:transcriptional regulator with XRE-family HTH domain